MDSVLERDTQRETETERMSHIEQHNTLFAVLMHAPVQVIYFHYMLTLSMECLWHVKICHLF